MAVLVARCKPKQTLRTQRALEERHGSLILRSRKKWIRFDLTNRFVVFFFGRVVICFGVRKKQNLFLNLSLVCYFLEEKHLKKAAKERLVYVHNTYGAKNIKEILFKTSEVVHQKYVCY